MGEKDKVHKILEVIGGAKNVKRVTNCVARSRLELKDENLVNDDGLRQISGVRGMMKKYRQ
ncbi:PTS sugar transporter subunit IIB [Streptococcus pneumoniae]|nr:PTS sugar transporter subunit IIB [Streptococcus pneumoniae]